MNTQQIINSVTDASSASFRKIQALAQFSRIYTATAVAVVTVLSLAFAPTVHAEDATPAVQSADGQQFQFSIDKDQLDDAVDMLRNVLKQQAQSGDDDADTETQADTTTEDTTETQETTQASLPATAAGAKTVEQLQAENAELKRQLDLLKKPEKQAALAEIDQLKRRQAELSRHIDYLKNEESLVQKRINSLQTHVSP